MIESPFIHDWLFAHAAVQPDAPAVTAPGCLVSYGELAERVRALAGQLSSAGVRRGDRVLAALPNCPATVVTSLAIGAAGATSVEVSRDLGADALREIAARCGARHLFVAGRDARGCAPRTAGSPLERLWVVHRNPLRDLGEPGADDLPATWVLEDGRVDPSLAPAEFRPATDLAPDAPAVILYTSGSTGRPRGVIQTFRNLSANSRSIVRYLGLTAADRALLILPLSYCYGRSVLQTHLLVGGSIHLDGRFAFPRVVMEALGSEGCTGFAGVPLTYEILRRKVDVSTLSLPRLRYLTQAGGAMAAETIDWVREAFRPARLFVMYGQTEATARLSYLPPERCDEKRGSIGIAIPGVELRVVDEQGAELPRGEVGHLVARGDNVTPGYLDDAEATRAILHDGWLWTGDLAERDADGFFFHRGRSSEVLKIGGHRVGPVEIEQVVSEHPDVDEAAVVAAAHALMGEVAVAFVVPRPGRQPTAASLATFCRARMPAHRVPARFTLVESLPRNAAGKLLRAELTARARADAPIT